jgi:hypothetical protein
MLNTSKGAGAIPPAHILFKLGNCRQRGIVVILSCNGVAGGLKEFLEVWSWSHFDDS